MIEMISIEKVSMRFDTARRTASWTMFVLSLSSPNKSAAALAFITSKLTSLSKSSITYKHEG